MYQWIIDTLGGYTFEDSIGNRILKPVDNHVVL